MDAVDYAMRKDVRNQVIREVDRGRQRELWQLTGMGMLLVGLFLFSAWQHFQLIQHGYRIEQMQQQRAAEEEINRRLRLEIETLRSPQRIERLATGQLHLVAPGRDEAIVIERVTAPERPPSALVATR